MKRFNINEFIWFIILALFTFYFYYILKTGKINLFISPRMIICVKCAFVFLIILCIYQLTKVFTVKLNQKINKTYILLAIMLLICYTGINNSSNSNLAEKKGLSVSTGQSGKNSKANENSDGSEYNGIVHVTEDNFASKTDEIGAKLDKYKGKKIMISGFVYLDKDFPGNEFVIARSLMTCCAADTSIIGLVCGYDNNIKAPVKDQWIMVTGIIDTTPYKDAASNKEIDLPLIKIEKIESIKKPDNPYVYP